MHFVCVFRIWFWPLNLNPILISSQSRGHFYAPASDSLRDFSEQTGVASAIGSPSAVSGLRLTRRIIGTPGPGRGPSWACNGRPVGRTSFRVGCHLLIRCLPRSRASESLGPTQLTSEGSGPRQCARCTHGTRRRRRRCRSCPARTSPDGRAEQVGGRIDGDSARRSTRMHRLLVVCALPVVPRLTVTVT